MVSQFAGNTKVEYARLHWSVILALEEYRMTGEIACIGAGDANHDSEAAEWSLLDELERPLTDDCFDGVQGSVLPEPEQLADRAAPPLQPMRLPGVYMQVPFTTPGHPSMN